MSNNALLLKDHSVRMRSIEQISDQKKLAVPVVHRVHTVSLYGLGLKITAPPRGGALTGVYAGVGGGNAELGLDELGDEGDEGGDDGALGRVGQADEQEGHVAEDAQRRFGEIWGGRRHTHVIIPNRARSRLDGRFNCVTSVKNPP